MHRREHEVARFRRGERDAHRLRVAHLADDDHVGRLPQRRAQGGGEVGRIHADFDLLDHAALVGVVVLDRVLHGHDVPRVARVDLRDERRHRRRLAGPGGAGDQHEAARHRRQQADLVREVQVGELWNAQRQRADGGRGAAALAVIVHAEPSEAADGEREVDGRAALIRVVQPRRDERRDCRGDVVVAEHELRRRQQPPLHPYERRRAGDEQEVAPLELAQPAEPRFNRPMGAGCFRGALRRDQVQFGRKMIEVIVEIAHGEIIGFGSGDG